MGDTTTAWDPVMNPWNQVESWPSSRNIRDAKFVQMGKHKKFSMTTLPYEDYVVNQQTNNIMMQSYIAVDSPASTLPYRAALGLTDAGAFTGVQQSAFVVKRRRFRWTNLWSRYYDGTNIVNVLRDTKRAHGVQMMVKQNTYTTENVPYFSVMVSASIEFKDRRPMASSANFATTTAAGNFLYPFTYAGANTL